jgi:hypothetical protein
MRMRGLYLKTGEKKLTGMDKKPRNEQPFVFAGRRSRMQKKTMRGNSSHGLYFMPVLWLPEH